MRMLLSSGKVLFDKKKELLKANATSMDASINNSILTISQSEADIKYEQAVYEDADEAFANIRISDYYTHKFYGDNININTNKDLKD